MKENVIIVRFSEIAIKSLPVRKRLIKILLSNIKSALSKNKIKAQVYAKWERIFVETNQIKKSSNILKHIFGIISFSPAIKTNLDNLEKLVIKKALIAKNKTFAVRVKRIGNHVFTSREMEARIGNLIQQKTKSKVNLTNPDIIFFIEIREQQSYLYFDVIDGPGGMPLGCEDRVFCVINNKKDLVACWLMMKRGCKVLIAKKTDIKPLKKWMYGKGVKIIKREYASLDVPLVSGNTFKDGLINTDKVVFYPVFAMKDKEIEDIYRKINS